MNSDLLDTQIRTFKDFLLLYNKVTELCFSSCVDNFFSRNVGESELVCVDKCVTKFARFNKSMMDVYIEVQTDLNNRRAQEMETAAREAEQKAIATATVQGSLETPNTSPESQTGSSLNSS